MSTKPTPLVLTPTLQQEPCQGIFWWFAVVFPLADAHIYSIADALSVQTP